MTNLRKIMAVILAITMIMSLAVSVSATTYEVTITNDVADYAYTAYQIFSGTLSDDETTLSDIEWGSDVEATTAYYNSQTIYQALAEIVDDNGDHPFQDALGSALTSAKDVAAALGEYVDKDNTVATQFAEVVSHYLSGSGTTSTAGTGNYVISNLDAGYYLIMSTTVPSTAGASYTNYILEVVKSQTITDKRNVPSLDKTVDDVNDSESATSATSVNTNDSGDWDIGDDVPYSLVASLPDNYASYTTYALTFHDDLSDGLTYNEDATVYVYTAYKYETGVWTSFEVGVDYYTYADGVFTKVADTSGNPEANVTYYTKTQVNTTNGGYTVVTSGFATGHDCDFEVVISDTNALKDTNDHDIEVSSTSLIVVEYSAELNTNAVVGNDGNPNTSYIEYSNNPNGSGIGESAKEKTVVFTYKLKVTKVDENNDPLADAEFKLYKLVTITEFESGTTYYTYNDTTKEFTEVTDTSGGHVGGTDYYILVGGNAVTGSGNDDNEFYWNGLDDGKYVLVESETPDGYNTIDPFVFYVIAEHTENGITSIGIYDAATGGNEITGWTGTANTGLIESSIQNNKGSNLPETGGIGTTIFYVVGGILVVGAVVLLITKKRLGNKED